MFSILKNIFVLDAQIEANIHNYSRELLPFGPDLFIRLSGKYGQNKEIFPGEGGRGGTLSPPGSTVLGSCGVAQYWLSVLWKHIIIIIIEW